MMKLWFWLLTIVLIAASFASGWYLSAHPLWQQSDSLLNPFINDTVITEPPLQKYAITRLASYPFQTSQLMIDRQIDTTDQYTSYLFSYITWGQKMTGVMNVPQGISITTSPAVIILLRGYVPPEIYQPGVGTKNAAAVFAQHGYVTLAPDFFGYGESDPEPSDTWEARFIKPINVIELIKSVQTSGVPLALNQQSLPIGHIGIWAHSNGGQIALTTLEALSQPIPTTLWAPVTAPFPYSILFFSDEYDDEGKETRQYINLFEKEYDVFDYSLTQHLDQLTGPLQLHHGTADEAALKTWSDEFVEKVEHASSSAIEIEYFVYPGADHNLKPSWNTAIQRDLSFFKSTLK